MKFPSTRKPPSNPETRVKILVAAQPAFAEKGYSDAGLREIVRGDEPLPKWFADSIQAIADEA